MSDLGSKTGILGVHYKLEKPVEETILYDKPTPQIARITLNRPEKHNSFYFPDMGDWLQQLIEKAVDDDEVKVIVLRGRGPSFCTGDDLNRAPAEAYGLKPGQKLSQMHRLRGFWKLYQGIDRALLFCPKTIIASVHGWLMGFGLNVLALSSDLVIAGESAKFSQRQQRIGFGGMGNIMMILHFGPKKAREMLLTGQVYTAQEMKDLNMVSSVVPDDQLEEETLRWANMVALHASDGLMISKMLLQETYEILGVGAALQGKMLAHTLFTNLVWHPDEMNFLKVRTNQGAREAFRQREARFEELGF